MAKRLSVTLDDDDERLVQAFAASGTHENSSLRAWAEQRGFAVGESNSEAALLRLLVRAGAESLAEHVLDAAYAQLAVEIDTGATESRAARDRYVKRTERTHAR
jgi:hypothetical protein